MHSCNKRYGFPAMGVALLALLPPLFVGLAGCGGGGGGGGGGTSKGNITLIGIVEDVETFQPAASATVTVNGKTATTSATGAFSLTNVPSTATTATVKQPNSSEQPLTLTLHLPQATTATTVDLGTVYLSASGYGASASGTVVTPTSSGYSPIAGANVTIAGTTVSTAADGSFSITGLPAGLGNDPSIAIGTVSASGYLNKPIYTQFVFTSGDNGLGQLILQKGTSTSPPGQPYSVTGQVIANNTPKQGVTVEILANGHLLTTTTTDTSGNYFFWVGTGTYSIFALGSTGQQIAPSPNPTVTVADTSTFVTASSITYQ